MERCFIRPSWMSMILNSKVRYTHFIIPSVLVHLQWAHNSHDHLACVALITGAFSVPQEPYTVMPGDSIRTTCYYQDGTAWGLGSSEEMCIAFMLYYPVKKLPMGLEWNCIHGFDLGTGCMTELEQSDLSSVEDLGRSFGTASDECVVAESPSTSGSTSKSRRRPPLDLLLFLFV